MSTNLKLKLVGFIAAVAAALAMVIGGVLATAPASSASTSSSTRTVSVPATQTWSDTGISLSQGETFSISASGTASPNSGANWFGANGVSLSGDTTQTNNCLGFQYAVLAAGWSPFTAQGVRCWSLIAKIGSSQLPIFIGKNFSAKAPVTGELYLGYNDDVFGDNRGSYSATITTG